jgi:multidrug efflux pump subunit AcrB
LGKGGHQPRQALGAAVFVGMIGVTAFELLFTPVFYEEARAAAGGVKGRRAG